MTLERGARAGTLGWLLAGLILALPACTQRPRTFPGAVQGLLADSAQPAYPSEAFRPVPKEELAQLKLPEAGPYTLGIGDTVVVKVVSSRPVPGYETGFQARVEDDGTIRLPTVGKVPAQGKTTLAVEEELTKPIREGLVRDAVVSVEVTGFGSRKFYVLGAVGSPGSLPVDGKATLLDALIAAGGTDSETADKDEDYVIRDQKAMPFSIHDVVMRGHPIGRLVMRENDIVYVPHLRDRQDFIYVFGEVGHAMRVPMDKEGPRGTQGRLTLGAAIAEAGGLNPRADINSITVYRGTWQAPMEYRIGVKDLYRYGHQVHLQPGDRIAVGTSAAASFTDSIGPGLQLISGTSSLTSLAFSATALAKN
jgi:protein involved in polysaccharide export with SLBB domain